VVVDDPTNQPNPVEGSMEKKAKKKYEKPTVTRIKLDAKCAVLGFCKIEGTTGSGWSDCNAPAYCWSPGS